MPLPLDDIRQVLIDVGELSKDDIIAMWSVSESEYIELKAALAKESLFEPGPKGRGGFVVNVRKRPLPPPPDADGNVVLHTDWENAAVERLAALLNHSELEGLLDELVYTLRRARTKLTGEDRRGTKRELAMALVVQHSVDLFADPQIRTLIAKKCGIDPPRRWHPGKGTAAQFVLDAEFPSEFG